MMIHFRTEDKTTSTTGYNFVNSDDDYDKFNFCINDNQNSIIQSSNSNGQDIDIDLIHLDEDYDFFINQNCKSINSMTSIPFNTMKEQNLLPHIKLNELNSTSSSSSISNSDQQTRPRSKSDSVFNSNQLNLSKVCIFCF